jgi:hypothetical protein
MRDSMTMEFTQILILIIEGLIVALVTVGWFMYRTLAKKVESLEVKMNDMQFNYLDRFKEVIANQTSAKENLMTSQNLVKEELIAQQVKVKEELMNHYRDTKEELVFAINELSLLLNKPSRLKKNR